MPIITVATSKGGAGKTTLARLLLGHAAQHGYQPAALDADLNHTLADWVQNLSAYPITVRAETHETRIVPVVEELQAAHDFIVIDTAGAPSQATLFAIGCADLVLVPLKLSAGDLVEAMKTVELVRSAEKMMKQEIPVRVVMVGYKPRTSIAAHIEKEIAEAKLPLLDARLDNLVAFEEMTFGGTVPMLGLAGMQTAGVFDAAMEIIAPPPPARKSA